MADRSKLKYKPTDNYTISLVLHNHEFVKFPDYDGKTRTLWEAKKEFDEVILMLATNPFGKVTLRIILGHDSESFMDRDLLAYAVDEVIRKHRTSMIHIEKGAANISYNA